MLNEHMNGLLLEEHGEGRKEKKKKKGTGQKKTTPPKLNRTFVKDPISRGY